MRHCTSIDCASTYFELYAFLLGFMWKFTICNQKNVRYTVLTPCQDRVGCSCLGRRRRRCSWIWNEREWCTVIGYSPWRPHPLGARSWRSLIDACSRQGEHHQEYERGHTSDASNYPVCGVGVWCGWSMGVCITILLVKECFASIKHNYGNFAIVDQFVTIK